MSTSILATADEFDTMSFDHPVELIMGEVVHMTNPGGVHGRVCVNTAFLLESWTRSQKFFHIVLSNDTGIQTKVDPDSVRGPDVCVVSKTRLGDAGIPRGRLKVAPEVAVEVRSPANTWRELVAKAAEFIAAGVDEVWIIDPDSRHVHVYQEDNEPTILMEDDTLTSNHLPGFQCQIVDFFLNLPNKLS